MSLQLTVALAGALLSSLAFADGPKDEADVKAIFGRLEAAWNKGDGTAWSNEFAEDADFTVWTGLRIHGRQAIEEGHKGIFSTIYKGTTLKFRIEQTKWVRPDVAIVLTSGHSPSDASEELKQTFVISKHGATWLIDAFQNTKVQDFQAPTK